MTDKKIWIVILDNLNKRKPLKDKVIVRARNKELAIQSGKANSIKFRNKKSHATAHLADPVVDLGCKRKADVLKMYEEIKKACSS